MTDSSRRKYSEKDEEKKESKNLCKIRQTECTNPCLNPDCDGIYKVLECEITPEDEKHRLVKEHFVSKKKPKAASIKRSPLGDGQWKAPINEIVKVIDLGNYGADSSALPNKTAEILMKIDSMLQIEKFFNPIHFSPTVALAA